MSQSEEIVSLLREIRDNQQRALAHQQEQLEIARSQLDRSVRQVTESIELQREAMARFRRVARVALPAVLVCIAMIVYLLVRYF